MKKKRRKQRRRKRKSGSIMGKVFLILILLSLPVIAFYYYSKFESEIVSSRAHNFMRYLEAGNLAEAGLMMTEESDELDDIYSLLEQQHITYSRISSSHLLGFLRGSAEVIFLRDGEEYPSRLKMIRQDDIWMVSELPPLKVLFGAFVIEENPMHISVMYQGEESRFRLKEPLGAEHGDIVYLIVTDEDVLLGEKAQAQPVSRLMVSNEHQIEAEEEGFFDLYNGEPLVYQVENDSTKVEEGSTSDLIPGRRGATFYMQEEKVLAVVLVGKPGLETTRVVLNDSSYTNLNHQVISLTANTEFVMVDKDSGEEYTFPAGRTVTVQQEESGGMILTQWGAPQEVFPRRISFNAVEETGRISLTNIRRDGWGGQSPAYRGTIDIYSGEEGLIVTSELPLEEYLYAVVPSEMPQDFSSEVLKIQSIISRSYAYRGILNSRFHEYGAHLDDSVNSQVYNKNPENETARQAVQETRGIVPFYNNNVVDTIFFSTSCGYTANSENVWTDSQTGTYPGESITYLRAQSQIPGEDFYLASEDSFIEFIDTKFEDAYDRNSPYFRWQIRMNRQVIEETIEHNLEERFQHRPDLVLTKDQGEFVSLEIPSSPLGQLLDIKVVERGTGGNIMVLDIEGTGGTYRLISEYTIRFTIRPNQYRQGAYPVILERGDGSTVSNFDVLPSAFAYFDIIRDGEGAIQHVLIKGGGLGHGVGLSQYGARKMVEQGHNFMEVIDHYYPGTQLVNINGK